MKKMYVAPEVEELEFKLEGFLCGSTEIDDGVPADMGGNNDDENDGI